MRNHYTNRTCGISLPNDKKGRRPNEEIDITIGVFFDGTGNNKYNIYFNQRAKKQYRKNYASYKGSFTNVALLWEMYNTSNPYTERVYIEGPGTAPPKRGSRQFADKEGWASSGEDDSRILGQGLGISSWGVEYKIKRAYDVIIEKVSSIIYNISEEQRVRSITFDVFGFSRGATASRLFIRAILLDKYSSFRVRLEKIVGRLDSLQVKIRFLGLFDTVSSIGLGEIMSDSKKHPQLFIPDKAKSVKTVVHLIAANEYRRYFPLTTVTSARYLGRNCMEYILPGAHSDIGGGYSEKEEEPLYMDGMYPPWKEVNNTESRDFRGYMSLADLRNRKWISDSDYQEAIKKYSKGYYKTAPYRHVYNEYSRIPLQIMYKVACQKGLVFRFTKSAGKSLAIPSNFTDLIKVAKFLKAEFNARRAIYKMTMEDGKSKSGKKIYEGIDFVRDAGTDKLLKSIRREFLHLSADNSAGMGATGNNRRRIIEG